MRAVVMTATGGREVLEQIERPEPVAGPGEALVEIAVAGVNFMDIGVRQGIAWTDMPNPKILGVEGVGRVLAVGEGVEAADRELVLQHAHRGGADQRGDLVQDRAARFGIDHAQLVIGTERGQQPLRHVEVGGEIARLAHDRPPGGIAAQRGRRHKEPRLQRLENHMFRALIVSAVLALSAVVAAQQSSSAAQPVRNPLLSRISHTKKSNTC